MSTPLVNNPPSVADPDIQKAPAQETNDDAAALRRPLTDEEVRRRLEAADRAQEFLEQMRARRNGRVLSPSWPIIRQARDERSEQI